MKSFRLSFSRIIFEGSADIERIIIHMTSNSKQQALQKIKKFCAYQDRCHSEVRSRLLSYRIFGDSLEEIIAELVREDYLNEERFSRSFVRGKFRMKGWGRNKILRELKTRGISDYCIKKGMTEIDENEYQDTLAHLMGKHAYSNLRGKDGNIVRKKLYEFAVRRGFESEIVLEIIRSPRIQKILNTTKTSFLSNE